LIPVNKKGDRKLFTYNIYSENEINKMDIHQARTNYEELGMDTLPLHPGKKDPVVRGWPRLDSALMWQNAPWNANIGIRTGGGLAVLDCDDKKQPGTFDEAVRWLANLGLMPGDYPVIQTASKVGRHIYFSFWGSISGDYRLIAPDFGAGELRYGSGAYVVAPPSEITDGGTYLLVEGDFRQIPWVAIEDLIPILSNKDTDSKNSASNIPRNSRSILNGHNIEIYKSRSEAEQALIIGLINAGHSFESVLTLFIKYPCAGKFKELYSKNPNKAITWLKRSYDNGVIWSENHESKGRRLAKAAINWAESVPWPGKTGAIDRGVFIAHATIAWRAGQLEYAASCRTLAEMSEVATQTARNATIRLCNAGLLKLSKSAIGKYSNVYRLKVDKYVHFLTTSCCEEVSKYDQPKDIFRTRGLGKSAGLIYSALQAGPASIKELAEVTGKNPKTVTRALKRMKNITNNSSGEVISMVEKEGNKWRAISVDHKQVAIILGIYGAGDRQHERNAKQRIAYRRSLERRRNIKTAGNGV
jgi:hypothetical protein